MTNPETRLSLGQFGRMRKRSCTFMSQRRLVCLAVFTLWLEIVFLVTVWPGTSLYHVSNEPVMYSERRNATRSDSTCTVYMAPSSVRGIDSMGIYTTKNLSKYSAIIGRVDGLSVPVIDYRGNDDEPDKIKIARKQWRSLFNEYWWGRGVADQLKWEALRTMDFKMTFSQLPNHHCRLNSLGVRNPEPGYNDELVNRSHSPGLGAFSYHVGRKIIVKRDVSAGEELFLNYGHCEEWREGDPEWTKHVVKTDDSKEAARVAITTWEKLKELMDTSSTDKENEGQQTKVFDGIVASAHHELTTSNEKAASLLPTTFQHLKHIMETSPSETSYRHITTILAREVGSIPRSVDWIRQNGLCVDNLVPGPSKLPHAGQGAFAQRFLPKGDVIVPAPMLHILDRDVLRINNSSQLLMNYCFGHSKSSLLLCPITNAMLINHCSARRGESGKDGPNAEYRWASGWDKNTDRWRQLTLEELSNESERGLSMEIVAIRDIKEGEEVFIDYGREWEEAWIKHVEQWASPAENDRQYVSPMELNEKEGPLDMLVSGDLRKIAEHPTIFTGCIYWQTDFDKNYSRWNVSDPLWEKLDDDAILERYSAADGEAFSGDYADQFDGSYWPCTIIHSNDMTGATYTVRIQSSRHHRWPMWAESELPRFVTNFPRESIRYFIRPYASDQHLPGTFRHHIEIRDDLFPDQWKDRQ